MDKRTPEEKENDARFANRRKMAFYSLYAVLAITLATTIKILIIPSSEVIQFTSIISWGISILGGVVATYIGAASFEQIQVYKSKTDSTSVEIHPGTDDTPSKINVEVNNPTTYNNSNPSRIKDTFIDGQTTKAKPSEFEGN